MKLYLFNATETSLWSQCSRPNVKPAMKMGIQKTECVAHLSWPSVSGDEWCVLTCLRSIIWLVPNQVFYFPCTYFSFTKIDYEKVNTEVFTSWIIFFFTSRDWIRKGQILAHGSKVNMRDTLQNWCVLIAGRYVGKQHNYYLHSCNAHVASGIYSFKNKTGNGESKAAAQSADKLDT